MIFITNKNRKNFQAFYAIAKLATIFGIGGLENKIFLV